MTTTPQPLLSPEELRTEDYWQDWFYRNYYVTRFGNVVARRTGQYLKLHKNKSGYISVSTSIQGFTKTYSVHRLVANKFVSNPDGKPCVNHIDNDRSNNAAENLEWVTYEENTRHMMVQGRHVSAKVRKKLTHCHKGHLFTPDNTYVSKSGRRCRTCKQDNERQRYQLRAEQRKRNV